jgi:small subunit ribosomal protein S6
MPAYEQVIISRPDISPAQVEALVADITTQVEETGGKIVKTEYWGLRTLAYRINKNRKAHYSLICMDVEIPALHEIERKMRINDEIMRYMTVRLEEHEDGPSVVLAKREREERKRPPRDF